MKSRYLILLISLGFITTFAYAKKSLKAPRNRYQLKMFTKSVDEAKLIGQLRSFVRSCRPDRMVGSTGHQKVVPYLKKTISKLDPKGTGQLSVDEFKANTSAAIQLFEDDFKEEIIGKFDKDHPTYKKWRAVVNSMVSTIQARKDVTGRNVIWEKKGSLRPNDILVIGAHFDTIANDPKTLMVTPNVGMPGADDNGSGVSIALAMIDVISRLDIPVTVQIVFFDWQELGYLGSRAFVEKYRREFKRKNFLGYLNLEMLGHDSQSSDKLKKLGNMRIYTRPDKGDLALAKALQKHGKKSTSRVRFSILDNSFNRADHISFWNAGFTALTFSQDWENDFNQSRYHGPNDFVETVNFKSFYGSYLYIINAVLGYLFNFKS